MKRTTRFFTFLLLTVALVGATYFFTTDTQKEDLFTQEKKLSKAQRVALAFEDNFERTKDADLGYPPTERMIKVMAQTRQLQQEFAQSKNNLTQARFRERGPKNIGGRTRTILIDKNDPSGNTIWAGGVGGGLWKLDNANASLPNWQKVSDYLENLSIGAMAQDVNEPNLMYFGTGEAYPNGDAINGLGMYRSEDGGENWELLTSTVNSPLTNIRTMLVHPETGDLYAGGNRGLHRSSDRGETWEKVLGVGFAAVDDIYDVVYIEKNRTLYASTSNRIYKSDNGDASSWLDLSTITNFPRSANRIEMAVSPSNPEIIYLIGASGGAATQVYRTQTGGENWQKLGFVGGNGDFTNGQAWYDLDIAVDPFNPQHVIAAGVPIFRSLDGGISWNRFANNMHVDQHTVVFDPERRARIYFGNDGGVWRSDNGSAPQVENKNLGYNVTQFYAGAMHPDAFSNYILGGTQDNNSLQLDDSDIANARNVRGGDGMLCHIDQNEPQYQIVSSQFGNYGLSTDGGKGFGGGASSQGSFVNPSDYDNDANILYAQTDSTGYDYMRWNVETGSIEFYDVPNFNIGGLTSVIIADPTTPHRIYIGAFGTRGIYRIDNANGDATAEQISIPNGSSAVSCINIDKNDADHLLVTFSNYGARGNIFESKDGGVTWEEANGNIPDMPVRWGLFAPDDNQQAIIATEGGVWFTEKLDGANTVWIPPALGKGSPITRIDMLQLRESDKMILAATHGRGMFTCDVFADPKVIFDLQRIGYLNGQIEFNGLQSLGAESFFWEFGDGATSTEEYSIHSYDKIGNYDVSLTINEEVSDRTSIKILPDKVLPYQQGEADYSGDFESRTEDYGVHTISGTGWERGKTDFVGKDGTHSGENAFVIGLEENFYAPNSHSILYLPNYDFSEDGIYEFSFWGKYFIQNGFDGFLVEYSIDKGKSWRILGEKASNWYDFENTNLDSGAFDTGTPYFANSTTSWTKYFTDVTYLSGQRDVAFRVVFKSENTGNHPGIAIDDVEITKFDGKLETNIVAINAFYSSSDAVTVEWTTQPEFYADEFIVERSLNGRDFEVVGNKQDAKGRVSSQVNNYSETVIGARDLYFYRVRSINENRSRDYYHEFTSPTVVVRRNIEGTDVFTTFPNPFTNFIDVTFNNFIEEEVKFELFDAAGKLLQTQKQAIGDVYLRLETPDLPKGIYFLRYKIGEQEGKVIKLLRG